MNKISPRSEALTDIELYQKCQEVGNLCRKYRNQFLGMLPEVMRRKLYLQYGMSSIYEFAAKLACISRETVNEVLRVHQHLEEVPMLQEKLVSGEIGYTKLRAVATVVRAETQELWLEKVESMSKPTLEVYVRELKKQNGTESSDKQIPCEISGLPGKEYDFVSFSVKVKPRTLAKMRVMKNKLEKKLKKPMSWDEAFEEMFKMLDEAKPKRILRPAQDDKKPAKRYIPASIRHEVEDKNSGICHFPDCTKPGEIFHHINRFALDSTHEAKTIVYLCKPHEQIAHHSLIEEEAGESANWQMAMAPSRNDPTNKAKYFIDLLVQKYRRIANLSPPN